MVLDKNTITSLDARDDVLMPVYTLKTRNESLISIAHKVVIP